MEKIVNDIIDLLHARLDVIAEAEKTNPEEAELKYIEGKKVMYIGLLETLKSYLTVETLKNNIEDRRKFLRFYSNLYYKLWDSYSYDCANLAQIIKMYGDNFYNKLRGRRDACSDLYHELKRMLEVIPDANL